MKRSDISDDHVVALARDWTFHRGLGVVAALVEEGVPEKLAVAKVLHLSQRGLLDYGTSPYFAWPTKATEETP